MERRVESHVVCGKETKMKKLSFICAKQKKKKPTNNSFLIPPTVKKNKTQTLCLCVIRSTEHNETQASVPLKVGKGNQQHL